MAHAHEIFLETITDEIRCTTLKPQAFKDQVCKKAEIRLLWLNLRGEKASRARDKWHVKCYASP